MNNQPGKISRAITRFVENPFTNLVKGATLLVIGFSEASKTLADDLTQKQLRVGHGLIIIGFFGILGAVPALIRWPQGGPTISRVPRHESPPGLRPAGGGRDAQARGPLAPVLFRGWPVPGKAVRGWRYSCDRSRSVPEPNGRAGGNGQGLLRVREAKRVRIHTNGEISAMKIGTIQALACVGFGTMLGFIAATRSVDPSSRADGATTARLDKEGGGGQGVQSPCCSEGATKGLLLAQAGAETTKAGPSATSYAKKPNVVFIMGDDVGWFNIGAYHRGMMAGKTPNLDRMAAQGMLFTDYYAEPSCTAGRANFITGQLPIRTGLTTVGQAGAKVGMPAAAPDDRHRAEVAWATRPDSSARTTWATSTSSCPRSTASTSSSATSTTSTRWRTRPSTPTRRS